MTHIPLSEALCRTISDRAVAHARQDLAGRGWKSASGLVPYPAEGQVGIKTTVKYLMHQESGIKPFLMSWVEGRTIPMSCAQGDGPHFRHAKQGVVGTPGEVDIPHKGKVWRNARWRHPGLRPKNFMHSAIEKAIHDSKGEIHQEVMRALKGQL